MILFRHLIFDFQSHGGQVHTHTMVTFQTIVHMYTQDDCHASRGASQ